MAKSIGDRLETYSQLHPEEVLLVKAEMNGVADEVMIFKGFSSSLMRSTAADLEIAVLPPDAQILSIDRFQSPYSPSQPNPIQMGMTWLDFEALLFQEGI